MVSTLTHIHSRVYAPREIIVMTRAAAAAAAAQGKNVNRTFF
jgi:hypothetical protein